MRICLFGAASSTIDQSYIDQVEEMARELVRRGHSLVFGGGTNGLMGAAARGVRAEGGKILGVVPKFFAAEGIEIICDFCDELIETDTMRERKQIMEDNSDAFIVVPGGIGTYEEFFEIFTARQVCRHNKPIAVYNLNGYYDMMQQVLLHTVRQNFLQEDCLGLYCLTDDVDTMFDYLEGPQIHRTIQDLKNG